jgi:hypothetical protein
VVYLLGVNYRAPPSWLGAEFGVAVAATFVLGFFTYALLTAHLVGRIGEVAIGLGLAWALLISAAIGSVLAPRLGEIATAVASGAGGVAPLVQPIAFLDALLAFSYIAFFVAFVDAHYRVATGVDSDGPT